MPSRVGKGIRLGPCRVRNRKKHTPIFIFNNPSTSILLGSAPDPYYLYHLQDELNDDNFNSCKQPIILREDNGNIGPAMGGSMATMGSMQGNI